MSNSTLLSISQLRVEFGGLVALMEISAYAHRVPSATVAQKYLAKTPYLSIDLDFRPGELKYEK
jgi:hypothetical protein